MVYEGLVEKTVGCCLAFANKDIKGLVMVKLVQGVVSENGG
jgi:hypothetical protein